MARNVTASKTTGRAAGIPSHPSMARRNLGMVVVLIGVTITAIDGTIVVLALPVIERDLHAPLSLVIWLIIGYLLIITVLATQLGRLGDIFGRVKMYEAGFAIFVAGSLLCALAWSAGR